MLAVVVASFVSGGIVNAVGHYLSFIVIGPLIAAVGTGLLFTIKEGTSSAALIGYQILYGAGLGLAFQLPGKLMALLTCDSSLGLKSLLQSWPSRLNTRSSRS
jgi:hypothetical protein